MQLSADSSLRRALAGIAVLAGIALMLCLYRIDEGRSPGEITRWVRSMRLPLAENRHFVLSQPARLSRNLFGESVGAMQ